MHPRSKEDFTILYNELEVIFINIFKVLLTIKIIYTLISKQWRINEINKIKSNT
jgi:hypothetical protein